MMRAPSRAAVVAALIGLPVVALAGAAGAAAVPFVIDGGFEHVQLPDLGAWSIAKGTAGLCSAPPAEGAKAVSITPLDDSTDLFQEIFNLEPKVAHYFTAFLWLPPDSKCAAALDNSLCPYMVVTSDDQLQGGGNLLVGGGNLLTANAGSWNIISGSFFLTEEAAAGMVGLRLTHLTPGETVCLDKVQMRRSSIDDFRPTSDIAIDKLRKRDVQLVIGQSDSGGQEPVRVVQTQHGFPFGTALNPGAMIDQVDGDTYRNFFEGHFNYCADEYEMVNAWEAYVQDGTPYPHTVVDYCDQLGLGTRGHTVQGELSDSFSNAWLWRDTPTDGSQGSVQALLYQRMRLWMAAYADRVLDIEPLNEMLNSRMWPQVLPCDGTGPCICDFELNCPDDLFPSKEGVSVHAWAFTTARALSPADRMIVNEYCVTGFCQPEQSNVSSFINFVQDLNSQTGNAVTAVSDQGHYYLGWGVAGPDVMLKLAAIEKQLGTDMDLWISEFDLDDPDMEARADGYEQALRAFFASPSVSGVVFWGWWEKAQWRKDAFLVAEDWSMTPAGERLFGEDGLLTKQWLTSIEDTVNTQAGAATVDFRGFHGKYTVYYGDNNRCQAKFEVPTGATAIAVPATGWTCKSGAPPADD